MRNFLLKYIKGIQKYIDEIEPHQNSETIPNYYYLKDLK